MQPPNSGPPSSQDIVTPSGSIRFTQTGIILEAHGNTIEIGPNGIDIKCSVAVRIKGMSVNVNGNRIAP